MSCINLACSVALAGLCVRLLKVSQVATVAPLLAVMLVGTTWQQS